MESVATGEQGDPPGVTLETPAPPRPQRRSRPSRTRVRLRRAIALVVLVVVLFAGWFAFELFQPFTGSGSGPAIAVTITAKEGARQIGDTLAADGIVSSGFFFDVRAMLDGDRGKFVAGTFGLRRGMSFAAALSVLTAPPRTQTATPAGPGTIHFTIPEGFTRRQIAVLAAAKGLSGSYIVASRRASGFDPRTYGAPATVHELEGFLFPATYYLTAHESVSRLVGEQLLAFEQNFNQLNFGHARAAGLTKYDVLIIASMVEREAQLPRDRALVAAVIYNRLRDGMTLGIDATLRYYLRDYTHSLTQSELALDTPYNTRLHHGLPPTPIANPGLASMIAAAAPASVPYLYYLTKPGACGALEFTTTYAQFLADSAAYNAARQRAGGRSPTTCP